MNQNLDSQIFELMSHVWKDLKVKAFKEMGNITMSQFLALKFIEKEKIVHMKDIAAHLTIEMPTATSLLDKLVKQSLVKRTTDKKDRRTVKVSLSEKGENLLINARKTHENNVKKMLSYLSMEQKKDMYEILLTLSQKKSE